MVSVRIYSSFRRTEVVHRLERVAVRVAERAPPVRQRLAVVSLRAPHVASVLADRAEVVDRAQRVRVIRACIDTAPKFSSLPTTSRNQLPSWVSILSK
jgi:hypothetical protein